MVRAYYRWSSMTLFAFGFRLCCLIFTGCIVRVPVFSLYRTTLPDPESGKPFETCEQVTYVRERHCSELFMIERILYKYNQT